jgi:hypothetical protein
VAALRPAGTIWPDLREEAERVVSWLERLRALADRRPRRARRRRPRRRLFVARLKRSHARHALLPRGAILVYRTRIASASGALVEHAVVALAVQTRRVDARVRESADREAARLVDARRQTLATMLDRADALVQLRRRLAVERLRGSETRSQLSLFPELDGPDAPPQRSTDFRDESGEPLVGAAQLAAVLIVD